jgi:hypothetical protein
LVAEHGSQSGGSESRTPERWRKGLARESFAKPGAAVARGPVAAAAVKLSGMERRDAESMPIPKGEGEDLACRATSAGKSPVPAGVGAPESRVRDIRMHGLEGGAGPVSGPWAA